jgi:D-glycero-alpha-D-manno-heptose-7-phosphate kinase
MTGVKNKVAISFKADTPAGTGLGSSGACSVALLKSLRMFKTGKEMPNLAAAAAAFKLTRALELPDGVQDPYACALGGYVHLEIAKDGKVEATHPKISPATTKKFFNNTLFFYTGINRYSAPILAAQDKEKVLELKHTTKELGRNIYKAFLKGDLDTFGRLMDEHWHIKKQMSGQMSSSMLDEVYANAKKAGALGGKLIGAGGGGYLMFYCPNEKAKKRVRAELKKTGMREMLFTIDTKGARTKIIEL